MCMLSIIYIVYICSCVYTCKWFGLLDVRTWLLQPSLRIRRTQGCRFYSVYILHQEGSAHKVFPTPLTKSKGHVRERKNENSWRLATISPVNHVFPFMSLVYARRSVVFTNLLTIARLVTTCCLLTSGCDKFTRCNQAVETLLS